MSFRPADHVIDYVESSISYEGMWVSLEIEDSTKSIYGQRDVEMESMGGGSRSKHL